MLVALVWLTLSLPFVNASQQQRIKEEKTAKVNSPLAGNDEETNPLTNTTEEKTPPSTFNEYLHEKEELQHPSAELAAHSRSHSADTYIAYHGELLSPPPEA